MTSEYPIDAAVFWTRLRKLRAAAWSHTAPSQEEFGNADCLCLAMGKQNEETDSLKLTAMHYYLLGYEFPETIFLIFPNKMLILSTPKRCEILRNGVKKSSSVSSSSNEPQAEEENYPVEFYEFQIKEETQNREKFAAIIHGFRSGNGDDAAIRVGLIKNEATFIQGNFAKLFLDLLADGSFSNTVSLVDVGNGIADLLCVKDEQELEAIRRSAIITNMFLKKSFVGELERIMSAAEEITLAKFAKTIEGVMANPKEQFPSLQDDVIENLDLAFPPMIQSSGSGFDLLKLLNGKYVTLEAKMTADTIVVALGSKYKNYCSAIARTYMINASQIQQNAYVILEAAHEALLSMLKPDVILGDVCTAIRALVASKCDENEVFRNARLAESFLPSIGHGIGLSVHDDYLNIAEGNQVRVKAGMVFSLHVGFSQARLPNDGAASAADTVAMIILDTVRVLPEPKDDKWVDVMTKCPSKFADVSYKVQENTEANEESGEDNEIDEETKKKKWAETLRFKKGEVQTTSDKRDQLQREIFLRKVRESQTRHRTKESEKKDFTVAGKLARGQVCSYNDEKDLLKKSAEHRLTLDLEKESVIIPIGGKFLLPFHLCTLKSVNIVTESADMVKLRFNFNVPTTGTASYVPGLMFPEACFIKELFYRCRSAAFAEKAATEINGAIKRLRQHEQQAKETESLTKQPSLELDRSGTMIPKLREIYVRPSLRGKKAQGILELHKNGLRFASGPDSMDLVFSNVATAVFQPSDNDILVLLHFHLKEPVVLAKKKTYDVQFYTEVMEEHEKITASSTRHMSDDQEIEEEERHKNFVKRLNTEFYQFVKKQEIVKFEMPIRKAEFSGTVNRNSVTVKRTANCLISLVEAPFFVLNMSDVEVCVLERVILGQKNFDMVFVLKDYTKPIQRIDTVEMKRLDNLKDWLTEKGVKYYECRQPLAWNSIMKEVIQDDQNGVWRPWSDNLKEGWASFLDLGGEADSSDEESGDSEEDDDAFQPDDEDEESESGSEDSDDDFATDDESEENSDENSDDEDYDEEDDEENLSWDEMEARAAAEDDARDLSGDDESMASDEGNSDAKKKKRKRGPAGGARGHGGSGAAARHPPSTSAKPKPRAPTAVKPHPKGPVVASRPGVRPFPPTSSSAHTAIPMAAARPPSGDAAVPQPPRAFGAPRPVMQQPTTTTTTVRPSSSTTGSMPPVPKKPKLN